MLAWDACCRFLASPLVEGPQPHMQAASASWCKSKCAQDDKEFAMHVSNNNLILGGCAPMCCCLHGCPDCTIHFNDTKICSKQSNCLLHWLCNLQARCNGTQTKSLKKFGLQVACSVCCQDNNKRPMQLSSMLMEATANTPVVARVSAWLLSWTPAHGSFTPRVPRATSACSPKKSKLLICPVFSAFFGRNQPLK